MTEKLTLPPVAKTFYTFCKKCDIDRYHRVLAHTSETTAKIECEVCHSRKAYSLPKNTQRAKAAGVARAAARKTSHTGEYELYNQKMMGVEPKLFNIRSQFTVNEKISHPKFGIGFVQKVFPEKIEVIFPEELKSLVHNRI